MKLEDKLNQILPWVTKPSRYTGNEFNALRKGWDEAEVKMVFAFPDVYEVGMSHLGGRILYDLVNRNTSSLMERTFAPWPDMEARMRQENIPLFSLESFTPVAEFDILGFSLMYELCYSNVLNMLDLAGISLHSSDRSSRDPLVIAGGPCTFNPEPLADFIDAFVIGEGEEVLPEVLQVYSANRNSGKKALLSALAQVPGIYVPSLYQVAYKEDGTIKSMRPTAPDAPACIRKRLVQDLDSAHCPDRPVVTNLEIIHDRAVIEIMRGCQRGCRFCQAGVIYRPARERDNNRVVELARTIMRNTGFDEISLASLSSADYEGIQDLVRQLIEEHGGKGIGVALPSLRVDAFSVGLAEEVQKVRKTTLTFAPEAGSQRLRDVINKNVREEDILEACRAAFAAGWLGLKLYFMLGLPTETESDLEELIAMVKKIRRVAAENSRRPPKINVSLSYFVPKPHTPFQWEAQITPEEMESRKRFILEKGKVKGVNYSFHDAATSYLEGVLTRGDRKLGEAIYRAWRKGAKFDGWSEYFHIEYYLEAMVECNLDPGFYAHRRRDPAEILPWDFIDTGITKEFLHRERELAYQGVVTPDCRESGCQGCGICPTLEIAPKYYTGEQ